MHVDEKDQCRKKPIEIGIGMEPDSGPTLGQPFKLSALIEEGKAKKLAGCEFRWFVDGHPVEVYGIEKGREGYFIPTTQPSGKVTFRVEGKLPGDGEVAASGERETFLKDPSLLELGNLNVRKRRTLQPVTNKVILDCIIRHSAEALSFRNYRELMDLIFCKEITIDCKKKPVLPDEVKNAFTDEQQKQFVSIIKNRCLPYTDADSYRLLKAATEAFVMVNCAVELHYEDQEDLSKKVSIDFAECNENLARRLDIGRVQSDQLYRNYLVKLNGTSDRILPYFALVLQKLRDEPIVEKMKPDEDDEAKLMIPKECLGIIKEKLTRPCFIELIWSYWHEEGMLVQTMNAISRRFQNIRGRENDPLANFETDPLRPLNNLLWGYIQDEQHRLTLTRRNYEYDHHYGIRLLGKAVRDFRSADSRSKFVEAFHHLLHLTIEFFLQEDDTNIIADGFPILNALKEVHTILTEGQHNQYGDLPSTARIEMLMQQWLLSRPEFREFLPTRIMTALPEPWMDRVDAMKNLQGWTDVSSLHFLNLAVFGEQILLSIRFGAWNAVSDPAEAANWARHWRPEIQGYMHAYRSASGVDLSQDPVDYDMPSVHLQDRLISQVHRR